MDKRIQRYIILVLLLVSFSGLAQKKDIAVVKDSIGNKVVQMSLPTFAHYYQTEQNLEAIHDSLPKLAKNIERERAAADSVTANLDSQIELSRKIILKKQEGIDDCMETAVIVELDNLYLDYKIEKLKKSRKWYVILGATGIIILKVLIP